MSTVATFNGLVLPDLKEHDDNHDEQRSTMSAPSEGLVAKMRLAGRLTIAEAALDCDVSAATIREWITTGRIRAVRVGHFIFVDVRSLKQALAPVDMNGSNKKARSSTP